MAMMIRPFGCSGLDLLLAAYFIFGSFMFVGTASSSLRISGPLTPRFPLGSSSSPPGDPLANKPRRLPICAFVQRAHTHPLLYTLFFSPYALLKFSALASFRSIISSSKPRSAPRLHASSTPWCSLRHSRPFIISLPHGPPNPDGYFDQAHLRRYALSHFTPNPFLSFTELRHVQPCTCKKP